MQQAAVIGNRSGRRAPPASALATGNWRREASGLGELLDVDGQGFPLMARERACDGLVKHRQRIEAPVCDRVTDWFALEETITLSDLTNTDCAGEASGHPQAPRGRSKEKRTEGPLVTLDRVVDGSGFVRRSRVCAGTAAAAAMPGDLNAPPGARVGMDAGIATADTLRWLVAQGYRDLVARRGGQRQFAPEQAVAFERTGGDAIRLQKGRRADGQEARRDCHSPGREATDNALSARFGSRFQAGLRQLAEGLAKSRGDQRQATIRDRIGRLTEASRGVGQHDDITVETAADRVTARRWERQPVAGTALSHPGVDRLATTETGGDEQTLWRTDTPLTALQAVFRSRTSERGLRPLDHPTESRSDGHLFIRVLASQWVPRIRRRLKEQDNHDRWTRLRRSRSVPVRLTASFRPIDGHPLPLRKPRRADPALLAIYHALDLDPRPGGTRKLIRGRACSPTWYSSAL